MSREIVGNCVKYEDFWDTSSVTFKTEELFVSV